MTRVTHEASLFYLISPRLPGRVPGKQAMAAMIKRFLFGRAAEEAEAEAAEEAEAEAEAADEAQEPLQATLDKAEAVLAEAEAAAAAAVKRYLLAAEVVKQLKAKAEAAKAEAELLANVLDRLAIGQRGAE